MNKIKMTTAESTLRSSSYASPETSVSEMHSEGVLCASSIGTTLSVEDWEAGTFSW